MIETSSSLTFHEAVSVINGKPGSGGWYNGHCTSHSDSRPSLGIKERADGSFAVKCQSGCTRAEILAGFERQTGKKLITKTNKRPVVTGLTLPQYAKMKRLNPLFLGIVFQTTQRLYNGMPAVAFSYFDEAGNPTGTKLRLSESSHDARWENYEKPSLYGLDVLQREQSLDLSRIAIVEGESDVQTLVYRGIPALGVSGKEGWKPEFANLTVLKNAKEILVVLEPNAEKFVEQVIESFPAGKAMPVVLPAKDPSELWINTTSAEFDAAWLKASTTDALDRSTPFTDTGNAERLVRMHGANFRWLTDEEEFRIWDGEVWRPNKSGDLLLPQTKEVVRAIASDDWRNVSESAGKRKAMIQMTKGEDAVLAKSDLFDTHPMLLNLTNGTYNLETDEYADFRREDFLTKRARVAFDPFATCPKFDEFLKTTFDGDEETISYVLKALGYSLTGNIGESCFFICYGLGANGKTTLIETMMQILGSDFARPAKFTTFVVSKLHDPKYELATFKGSRFVKAVEPSKAGHLDEEVLKQITGGDQIMARNIYHANICYYPEFKLWLAMNNKPTIIGTDEGIWRRVRLIPFNVRVPEARKVKDFHKVLFAEEGPGILNRLLEGCQAWRTDGLTASTAIQKATQEFRAESNVVLRFLNAMCSTADRNAKIAAGALHAAYRAWAEKQNEFVLRGNEFADELAQMGLVKKRGETGFVWYGITLRGQFQM